MAHLLGQIDCLDEVEVERLVLWAAGNHAFGQGGDPADVSVHRTGPVAVKDRDQAIGADQLAYIEAVQFLVGERTTAPRLEIFAQARLFIQRKGVPLADAAGEILVLDRDPLTWDLETDDDLLARGELLRGLGANGEDAVADCMMGAGWNWIRLSLIRYVDRHDLFWFCWLLTGYWLLTKEGLYFLRYCQRRTTLRKAHQAFDI